ncbi:MAG: imidazole glycerol phosphate synthase subunit HisH [Sphingomonadaceae bacterium]
MGVALIDYGAGNLRSAARALEAAGANAVQVTARPEDVRAAGRIVLPGVGSFGHCVTSLRAIPGMVEALTESVRQRGIPFLGICVGMQLLADEGHEYGVHSGLGWIGGTVERMQPPGLKVPQIGWNAVLPVRGGLISPGYAYFVHSYVLAARDPHDVAATTNYGGAITAAVQRDNILGVQFHPEKSQSYGLDLLARWLAWKP